MSNFLQKIKSSATSMNPNINKDIDQHDETTGGLLHNLPKTYTTKLAPILSYLSSSYLPGNPINALNCESGMTRRETEIPSRDYLLKVQSFQSLKENFEQFDSSVFEAGGHKWKLCLYPNGNKKDNGSGYISLYLNIVETDAYPRNWEVHVNFKFFVFDKIQDNYLIVQDAQACARRFHEMKTEWGFSQMISHEDFYKPSNGFLVNDTCLFGAEVEAKYHSIVKQLPGRSLVQEYPNRSFTWDFKRFSKRASWDFIESEVFVIGELVWTISIYPRGYRRGKYGRKGNVSLCLYLHSQQEMELPSENEISIEYKMILLNRDNTKHLERSSSGLVGLTRGTGCWEESIIPLKSVLENSNGFIKNDTLTLQLQISLPV